LPYLASRRATIFLFLLCWLRFGSRSVV
jgi:hypothetical protein